MRLLRVVVLVSVCASLAAGAAVAEVWTTRGADQFGAGELKGVSVTSEGEVVLAPEAKRIEGVEAQFAWKLAAGKDGALYLAAGGPGAVYRVEDGKAALLTETDQAHVLSLLALEEGTLLAGTAPDGLLLSIGADGKTATFADLEESYIWDLAPAPDGGVWCATGPNGRLVLVDAEGKATTKLEVKQKNIVCIAAAPDGTVYLGTAPDGIIYRLAPDGAASVVFDAEEEEVHDLWLTADGVLYACTAQGQATAQPAALEMPEKKEEEQPAQTAPGRERTPSRAPGGPNSIYRIEPDKGAYKLVSFKDTFILSLALRNGEVLAGTGPKGRIMAVESDSAYRILAELEGAHVTALAVRPDGSVLAATSNPAGLWRLSSQPAARGTLISEPFDAGYLSRWGRLWWQGRATGTQGVEISLRTGNTAEPDEHWSGWSEPVRSPAGGPVDVPVGRFAQFKAVLSAWPGAGSPRLVEVGVSYRQTNRRPRIVDVHVDGQSLLKSPSSARERARQQMAEAAGRAAARAGNAKTVKKVSWEASDPNGDDLRYELYYRATDEAQWKPLAEDLDGETSCEWDTARVPDGYYMLRLVASDDPARSPDEALTDERVVGPLLVDNRPPEVVELLSRRLDDGSYELSGLARDAFSPIAHIQVSRNAGPWQPAFPEDGILDGQQERFRWRSQPLEAGEHVFVVAATDAAGNVASARLVVVVPAKQ